MSYVIQMGFWASWLIIPLIYEFLPVLYDFARLLLTSAKSKLEPPAVLPRISVIIPVYNSEATLYRCIESISKGTYPGHLINIIVADNGSRDNSFTEFSRAQKDFMNIYMQWIRTASGKSQALNTAIYGSTGKYVINIDSDGYLHPDALMNMIIKFENDLTIDAMTGVILTDHHQIKPHHLLQKLEYMEYCFSFLVGRNNESRQNRLYTMAGAFSAFRKSSLLATNLYNTNTVGEDMEITFQIRVSQRGKVGLCANAFFYTEPIDNFNDLYVQRQRWQRGEIEVVGAYAQSNMRIVDFFRNFVVRRLIVDHTITFLRLIWLFAPCILIPFGYAPILVLTSYLLLYILYLLMDMLQSINCLRFLDGISSEKRYLRKNWYLVIIFPLYTMATGIIRGIGIINMMLVPASWKTRGLDDETESIKKIIRSDIKKVKDLNGRKKKL